MNLREQFSLLGLFLTMCLLTGQRLEAASASIATDLSAAESSPTDNQLPDAALLLTIGGRPVYWGEYRFWLTYLARQYMTVHGLRAITDWQAPQDGIPLKQSLLAGATTHVCDDRAIEAQSAAAGIKLTSDDTADLARVRSQNLRTYGSDSEYQRIVDSMYGSEAQFLYLAKIDRLSAYLFAHLYGPGGEKCDDQCVADFTHSRGINNVLYIFRSRSLDKGRAASQRTNLQLLKQIRAQWVAEQASPGSFSQLIVKYSDDQSFADFPAGRVILPGTLGSDFDAGISKLSDNELSEVISTPAGDYLVRKMPLTPQTRVDTNGATLRYWAAHEKLFEPAIASWCADQPIEYADSFRQVDLEALRY